MDLRKMLLIDFVIDYVTGATLPEPDSSDWMTIRKAVHCTIEFIEGALQEPDVFSNDELVASATLLAFIAGLQGDRIPRGRTFKQAHLDGLKALVRKRLDFELREVLIKFFHSYASTRNTNEIRSEVCEYIALLPGFVSLQNPEQNDIDQKNTQTPVLTPAAAFDATQPERGDRSHQNRDLSVGPYVTESEYWTAPESISGSRSGSSWSERDGLPPPYALSESCFHSYESRFESLN